MAVFIREIRNNAGATATVEHKARPSDTDGNLGIFPAGVSKQVNIEIPWCGNTGEFDARRIRIDVAGGGSFAVWQYRVDARDRVRVSTNIAWSPDAEVIGGVAATGVLEDLALSNERMLVINDFTLWLVPYGIATTIATMTTKARDDGYRLCGVPADRRMPSIPRKSAVSFSMPGISSDAFDRGQTGARFLSRDSGQRREFTLDQQGVVRFQPPVVIKGQSFDTIGSAISHAEKRTGLLITVPPFELLAANGGRVFAKERGADRFYFAMVDLPYIHVRAKVDGAKVELPVPSTYFKLDPEFNQVMSPPEDLIRSVQEDFVATEAFGGHTAAERFPLFRLLLGFGVMEAMIVRNRRLTWHLIDARTPMIDVAVNLAASLPANLMGRQGIVDRIMASVSGTAPPSWVPALDDVCYRSDGIGAPPGGATGGPDAALNAPGGLVVFVRGGDGAVWHAWQAQPDGSWSGWASLGGVATSDPGAVLQTGGRLVVFVRVTGNAIWHRWQKTRNGEWSGWASIGAPPGAAAGGPAAALNDPGGLVVFVRGADGAVWHAWQAQPDGSWSGWVSLGGAATSDPGAVLQTGGRLVVFVRGTDNAIWHRGQKTRNGEWSAWASIGAPPGGATSGPDAALNAPGGLVVFVRGADGAVWYAWQAQPDSSWSGWASLGGVTTSDPGAVLQTGGRLVVFARGTDNAAAYRWQTTRNGAWSEWKPHEKYQKTIHYERVLDIGVGHVPHHEQFESVTGGELMPLRVPAALSDYWADPAQPYRLMNGPVRDADGFIDGTATYYLLVQLKNDAKIGAGPQSLAARVDGYGLLFVDEQSFFAQRWRAAHPDDWRGPMGSMAERVHTDKDRHRWDPELYWCPFRGGHVGPRSRLAVAAQVALVTGEHPESGEVLLYSVNYALSAMDRTWRWRKLPPVPARYFDGQSLWNPVVSTLTGDEQVPSGPDSCVYPQTVRLRDDMTICLRGRGRGADGSVEVGRWYQRYLPATNELVPPVIDLHDVEPAASGNRSGRPKSGYSHRWKFLPESVFRLADQFSHFGVYDVVDSRMQFYTVTPSSPDAHAALLAGERGAWVNDPKQVEDSKRIKIRGYSFRFDWARLPWPSLGDPGWGFETLQSLFAGTMALLIGKVWPSFLDLLSAADRDEIPAVPPMPMEDKSPPSLYNPDTRLRIVRRGSQWIALHWDKRDDDLMPFNLLPARVVELESREGPELERAGGRVQVTLEQNQWVEQPPAVRVAYFNWAPPGPSGEARAVVGFVTDRPQGALSNVWRVRIAAFVPGGNGKTVSLLDVVTFDVVTGLPNFTSQLDGSFHEHLWAPNAAQLAELRQYCSPAGALRYGTSIWVEDVVGHVSVPEEVLWLGTPQPMDLVLDREISVPESLVDVDTGIELHPGDDYAFDARGTIRPHWLMAENGPKGLPQVSHEPKYPLSYGDDAYPFSLIGRFEPKYPPGVTGRFGTHPWFYVGARRPRGRFAHTVVPHRLHLRTNDDAPGGGSGQFFCRVRVWRSRPAPAVAVVIVAGVVANPAGSDVQPEGGERVMLQNTGSATASVGGWYLTDVAGHRMTIGPGYEIAPGATLAVFTGRGTSSPSRFYCQRRAAVLNNEGDTIVLHSADGKAVSTFTY